MKKLIVPLLALASVFSATAKTPNVIYILADDLGIGDLSCYGQEKLKTPNVDKLAKEGMQFFRHYSGSTVCAPSRCTLMTGLHTGHSAIRGNAPSPVSSADGDMHMPADTFTMPKMFKSCGYNTGIFGKWGLGAQGSDTSPLKAGFDRFYGYNGQAVAHFYYPDYLWSNNKKVMLDNNGKKGNAYSADLIQGEVLKYIQENKSNPFFIYYAMTLPHAEMVSPEKYLEQFRGKFEEVPYKGTHYSSQKEPRAAFAAMVYAMDCYVGQIVEQLEKDGILDNTIIIFSSDNGTHNEGGHTPDYWNSSAGLRGIKRDLYEGGIRTPMIVYWKGKVKESSKTDLVSVFWDVLPTFAEIIDAKIPDGLDGISFLPTLLNKDNQETHDYLYWEFHERGGRQAVLKDDWKLVKLSVNYPKSTKYELYNLKNDEQEKNNLYAQNQAKAKELKAIMDSARTESDIEKFKFKKPNK